MSGARDELRLASRRPSGRASRSTSRRSDPPAHRSSSSSSRLPATWSSAARCRSCPRRKRALDAAAASRAARPARRDAVRACASSTSAGLAGGLFLPVSELNRMRQERDATARRSRGMGSRCACAVERGRADRGGDCDRPEARRALVPRHERFAALRTRLQCGRRAQSAMRAGATEIVLDPFLRHPTPPLTRVSVLADDAARRCDAPPANADDRAARRTRARSTSGSRSSLPILSGHVGLAAELAESGRDVTADYAVNCFNQHTAAAVLSARRQAHRAVNRAHRRRAERTDAAMGRQRVRRPRLWPARRNDDRTLRSFGGVRPRADDVPRSLRAEAHERDAHRSGRLHVSCRDRQRLPQSAAAFAPD